MNRESPPPSPEAPTGLVTLVFTDVEGSTVLWERSPDAMRRALCLHDGLLREALAKHRGYEVKTEGDAFMVAFADPGDGLRWCLEVQRRLPGLDWPPALLREEEAAEVRRGDLVLHRGLRVRMGGHRGEPDCRPDPITGRMDYFGPAVNRAARVGAAGHGGQLLLSGAWAAAARPTLAEEGAELQELGEHGLKGLTESETLLQALPAELAAREFPPVRTLEVPRDNLPGQPPELLGRGADLEDAEAALAGGSRCLSLLGPGGVGKSTLARALAHRALAASPDREVWLVPLDDGGDGASFEALVARTLGLPLPHAASRTDTERVGEQLATRGRLLLVLDGAEARISRVAAAVRRWLEVAPVLSVLVTSREPLNLGEETRLRLAPLEPEHGAWLFRERARRIRADFELDAETRPLVEEILELVDGLPLAIELAAARLGVLRLDTLARKLGERLDVLRSRERDRESRHRTLEETLLWSWELLDEEERDLLARSAIYPGGFELGDVEEVLAPDDEVPAEDRIESLVEKSLLHKDPERERFSHLHMVRSFLETRLAELDETSVRDMRTRQTRRLAERFPESSPPLWRRLPDREERARLRRELPNLRVAVEHGVGSCPREAARLAVRVARWAGYRGPAELRDEALERGLEAARAVGDATLEATVLSMQAADAFQAADLDRAEAAATGAIERSREAEDEALLADCLSLRGLVRVYQGDGAAAMGDARAALGGVEGDDALECLVRRRLATLHLEAGDHEVALAETARILRVARREREPRVLSLALMTRGAALAGAGELELGRAALEAALGMFQAQGMRANECDALELLARIHLWSGDVDAAGRSAAAAHQLAQRTGQGWNRFASLLLLGLCAFEQEDDGRARDLLERALTEAREMENEYQELALPALLAALRARAGDVDGAGAAFEGIASRAPEGFLEGSGLGVLEAYLEVARGDVDAARARLDAHLESHRARAADPDGPPESALLGRSRLLARLVRKGLPPA